MEHRGVIDEKESFLGAADMAQRLRILAAFVKDVSLVPRIT